MEIILMDFNSELTFLLIIFYPSYGVHPGKCFFWWALNWSIYGIMPGPGCLIIIIMEFEFCGGQIINGLMGLV